MIILTENARKELIRFLSIETDTNKFVRVFVEAGGCSGLSYGIVFDEKRDGDHIFSFDGLDIIVDNFSLTYIGDVEVDFSESLIGGGFKMNNPNAKSTCGCGSSFST